MRVMWGGAPKLAERLKTTKQTGIQRHGKERTHCFPPINETQSSFTYEFTLAHKALGAHGCCLTNISMLKTFYI